jgi:hypothetical protein
MRKVGGGFNAFERGDIEQHPSLTMEMFDATRRGANIDERLSASDARAYKDRMRAGTDEPRASRSCESSRKSIQEERERMQQAINTAIMMRKPAVFGSNIIAYVSGSGAIDAQFSLGIDDRGDDDHDRDHDRHRDRRRDRIDGGNSIASIARSAHLHEKKAIARERSMRKKEVSERENADYIIDLVRSKFETEQE